MQKFRETNARLKWFDERSIVNGVKKLPMIGGNLVHRQTKKRLIVYCFEMFDLKGLWMSHGLVQKFFL